VNPLSDQVLHRSSLPLWCHVTDTPDSGEIETALVGLNEALDFLPLNPSDPWVDNGPIELLDPLDGAKCWNCTIGVSREEKHLNVILPLHDAVNPERAFVLLVPIRVHSIVACHPCRIIAKIKSIINM